MAAAAPCHPGTRWERRACCCAGCPWGSAHQSIPKKDEGNRAAALGTSRAGFAPPSQPPDPILTAQVSPRHVRSPPCPVPAPNSAPQPLGGSFPPDRAIWGEEGTNIHVQPSLLRAKTAAKAGLGGEDPAPARGDSWPSAAAAHSQVPRSHSCSHSRHRTCPPRPVQLAPLQAMTGAEPGQTGKPKPNRAVQGPRAEGRRRLRQPAPLRCVSY